ncbi:MAG: beta-phosphoglucomutase [Anaerolineae bacterium]|nr:beta-phosphoglucomutase [Anaerolineae bacterium]
MTNAIRAFIFDLDGVITDTAEFHFLAWKQLADEEGIEFTREDNEQLRGVSRRESLRRMLKGRPIDESTAQLWMERKNDYYRKYLETITPRHTLPGVPQFLSEAKEAGILLGIGSASKNAHDVLARLQLLSVFDAIGDGYSVVNTKPAPDLFIWVAGRLNTPPNHAVVFEDAEAGIDAALAGGFYTVGIGSANVQRAHLVAGGLDALTVNQVLEHMR